MRQILLVLGAFALGGVSAAVAGDPPTPPASPQQVQPKVILPGNQAIISQLEEDLESLEAQQETRKAYVKAAEVGIKAANLGLERMLNLVSRRAASQEEADRARLDVEGAKAQYEIRVAELREVEVKIKYAKKRLDEAKNGGVRPLNPPNPPAPPRLAEPPKPPVLQD